MLRLEHFVLESWVPKTQSRFHFLFIIIFFFFKKKITWKNGNSETQDYVFLLYNRENLSPGQKKMELKKTQSLWIRKNKMLRCSCCTAGGTILNALNKKCYNCPATLGHVCYYCRRRSLGGVLNISCSGCRPHVCLSKCSRGCMFLFRPCDFFAWDWALNKNNGSHYTNM